MVPLILGYQILDPQTGYVIPPPINQGPQKQTVNFKRETNQNALKQNSQATASYSNPPPVPTSYRQQSQQESGSRNYLGDFQFPSIYSQFKNPFTDYELSPTSSSSTAKRQTSFRPSQEYNAG